MRQVREENGPVAPERLWLLHCVFWGSVLAFPIFFLGYGALDQPRPDTGQAGWLFGADVALALALGSLVWRDRRWRLWVALPGLALGLPLALLMQQSYGRTLFLFTMAVGGPVEWTWLICGTAAGIFWSRRQRNLAANLAIVPALAILFMFGGAALYLLATLPQQAEKAASAQWVPGPGPLAFLAVLAVAVLWRRRSKPCVPASSIND